MFATRHFEVQQILQKCIQITCQTLIRASHVTSRGAISELEATEEDNKDIKMSPRR